MSKNFARSLVVTVPDPATSGASLTVTAGEGSRFFAGKASVYPVGASPTPANAEVVAITNVSSDTLTLMRAQELSTARAIIVGDVISQDLTAGMYDALLAADTTNAANAAAALQQSSNLSDVASAVTARANLGLGTQFTARTTTYTATVGDFVLADASSAGFTVTLPASPSAGHIVGVKKTDSTANVVTVVAAGKTIDGDSNATIVTRNAGATFEYDGSNWRITGVGTITGAAGPTGPTGPTGGSGVQPIMGAGVLNSWYVASGLPAASLFNRSTTAGTLILGTPFICPEAMTVDAIGCYVKTGGTAGAVVRLGVYQPSAANPYRLTLSSAYATLLSDAGTVAATSSDTRATATLASALTFAAGATFCVGVAVQVATVGIYCEANSNLFSGPWGSASDLILNGSNVGVLATGVTSSLPATFTPSAFAAPGIGGAGFFRRSA